MLPTHRSRHRGRHFPGSAGSCRPGSRLLRPPWRLRADAFAPGL